MNRHVWCLAPILAMCIALPVQAQTYTQLNIPNRVDYTFDTSNVLYVSAGSQIIRYDTKISNYLTPFNIAGSNLQGIDLLPGGSTIAVADSTTQGANNRIHLVNAGTGSYTSPSFVRESLESGTFMVAWGADNRVLLTSDFAGSGWIPLRRHDPQLGTTTTIMSVRQSTMLTPSANRQTIGLAEANTSAGTVRAYNVAQGAIEATTGTGWFTYEVGVNRDGTRFAVPTYNGTYIYSRIASTFTEIQKLGQYADHGPIDAVFSPNANYMFTAEWDFSVSQAGVKVYNTDTWQQVASLDNYNFPWTGNGAMGPGRMEVSPDGRWLAVSVNNAVRLYNVSNFAAVPEPATVALVGVLVVGTGGWYWRSRSRHRKLVESEMEPI